MGLRTCAAHAVSDHALSAARLRIEQSTLHRRMRFSVLERLDALPMVDLCRVTRTTQQRSAARQRAGRRPRWRSTWRDRSERRCLLLCRLEQLRIAGHRSDHLHEHCISFVVAPTVGDALIICRSHNVVLQSARVYRDTERRSGSVDSTHRRARREGRRAPPPSRSRSRTCRARPRSLHHAESTQEQAGGRASVTRLIVPQLASKLVRVLFDSPCTSTIFLPSSMAVRSSN